MRLVAISWLIIVAPQRHPDAVDILPKRTFGEQTY